MDAWRPITTLCSACLGVFLWITCSWRTLYNFHRIVDSFSKLMFFFSIFLPRLSLRCFVSWNRCNYSSTWLGETGHANKYVFFVPFSHRLSPGRQPRICAENISSSWTLLMETFLCVCVYLLWFCQGRFHTVVLQPPLHCMLDTHRVALLHLPKFTYVEWATFVGSVFI